MDIQLPENIDLDNPEFQNVWDLIQHTRQSVFLTGKAGTGKSTFLKYICANTRKKYVVLAPTGIAAVNVGGQTLHSFFKIPFRPLLADDPDFAPMRIRKTLRYTKEKVKLIRELDLIIIDEISMVRADIIDFVDRVLRNYSGNMREPFGGKQLLFVGDIFQLEPVVTRDMRQILQRDYRQFFFFNAHVFADLCLVPIELRKIYRQSDSDFVAMLDRVRVSHATRDDLMRLNARCNPNYRGEGFTITLATRRDTVNSINDDHMAALKTPEYVYEGEIEGTFPENDLPTALQLTLKEGAQVIFIRNDKEGRWVNGTIGRIQRLTTLHVFVELEDGIVHQVEEETWENIQYAYDEKKQQVVENVLGSFRQFPVKPAWALTVHKSQGLTFNNVVIDFAGGAFTSGQTYVALSRCTSLEGITLLKPLSERDIIVNTAVVDFSRRFNDQQAIDQAKRTEQARQLYLRAKHAFDHQQWRDCVESFASANAIDNQLAQPAVQRLIVMRLASFDHMVDQVRVLQEAIDSQHQLLRQLASEYAAMGDQSQGFGSLVGEEAVTYGEAVPLDDIAIRTALANYDKALRIDPECIAAMLGKGRLMAAIDQTDRAIACYEQALATDGDCYDAHMGLATLHSSLRHTPEAIKAYKRACKADKHRPEPHEALAAIYEKIGLDDLADQQHDIARRLREPTRRHRKPKSNG